MWHVEEEPGRGVTIENQDGRLLMTFFGYDEDGNNKWWQGVGHPQNGNFSNSYQGDFTAIKNGQCAGCDYVFPELDETASLGPFTVTFSDGNHAQMTWKGKDLNLKKYFYGHSGTVDRLRGFWLFKSFYPSGLPTATGYTLFDKKISIDGRDVLMSESLSLEGTFKAATTFMGESGREIVVVADGNSDVFNGDYYMIYAFQLNHTNGKGGFDNDPETGRYFYGDTMTKDPLASMPYGPFYAFRIMDHYQSKSFYSWYTYINSFLYSMESENKPLQKSTADSSGNKVFVPQALSPELLATMDFLVGAIADYHK